MNYTLDKLNPGFSSIQPQLFKINNSSYIPSFKTIDYLGSKRALLDRIIPSIEEISPKGSTILDLFSGSGSVAYALQPNFVVYANDIQEYSYVIAKAILTPTPNILTQLQSSLFLDHFYSNFSDLQFIFEDVIAKEHQFFSLKIESAQINEYRNWSDSTPFWGSSYNNNKDFLKMKKYFQEDTINRYRKNIREKPYILFSSNFMNSYFGVLQSIEIDSIRYAIDQLKDSDLKDILLTSLMSAMSECVSSTTHFAQFLHIRSLQTFIHITEKRKKSIWDHFLDRLLYFSETSSLLSKENITFPYQANNLCFNLDYIELLEHDEIDKVDCIYVDPPYFKEHYSRYYHVIETLIKYDYPKMTINARSNLTTEGRYRDERYISTFSKKSSAPQAFRYIANKSKLLDSKMVVSYSSSSIVSISTLMAILKESFTDIIVKEIPYKHSKQGRNSRSEVTEYLLVCK